MKLWQKQFFWALVIVMIAVSSTSIIVLNNNYEITMDRQARSAQSEYEYMVSNLKNRLISERRKENAILLSAEEIVNVMDSIFYVRDSQESEGIALFTTKGELVYQNQNQQLDQKLFDTVMETGEMYQKISDDGQRQVLSIGSKIRLEQQDYLFFTTTNITQMYEMFESQQNFTQKFTMAVSLESALLILCLCRFMLAPLRRLNRTTKKIAEGDYASRVEIKGNDEIADLARNMNAMADAVEKNVELLSETAENRRQFINNFSHEMKTPLTSILGFADLMRIKRNISEEQLFEYSNIIFEEASRLKGLSGKLMELITVGDANLEFTEFTTGEILEQIRLVMKPTFATREMKLDISWEDALIDVDEELFKSLVLNIIDNAIKASEKNSMITVRGTVQENSERYPSEVRYQITIQDEGIGIPKESLAKIMEPFYMVDKARGRKAGGAGMGLALCRQIADIHHADFEIKSELGKGTLVTLNMPAKKLELEEWIEDEMEDEGNETS